MLREEVLEDPPIELIRRRREIAARPKLQHLVDPLGAFRKEKPKAELLQLLLSQVLPKPEHVLEVVSADLHRRLAHLVCRLRYRMAQALQHDDAQVGEPLAKLN